MRFNRKAINSFVFLFVVAIGAVAVLLNGNVWQKLRTELDGAHPRDIFDGHVTQLIDQAVKIGIPRSVMLNGWAAGLEYKLLGDAGPEVRAGCVGWLFLAEELQNVRDGQQNMVARAHLREQLEAEFRKRNILLVSAPVPDKNELAQNELCGLSVAMQARQKGADWQKLSTSSDYREVKLQSDWPAPGFWRTDSHWNESGARFAAKRIAALIQQRIGVGTQNIRIETAATYHDRPGDLMRLAELELTSKWFGPPPDQELREVAMIERKGNLLDETPPPDVVLAGSSFSLNSGFLDYLQAEISREVVQMSQPGSGFAGAVLELLEKHGPLLDKAKIVVWEWPMHSLTQPITLDERRFLEMHGR